MGEFFRSAINYLSQAGGQYVAGGPAGGRAGHPLVGCTVQLSGVSFKAKPFEVRSLLAEGGYALVFAVQDPKGEWFALKRQLAADRAAAQAICQEIQIMKELSGHPCIVAYTQATRQELKESPGRVEFLMLMELCTGGPLIDLLQKSVLGPEQICKIFHAACSAVQHMHDRSPPITHRDIKIENLLFDSRGFIRLCDFGSATTEIFRPDDDWSVSKRNLLEEEMAKYTTPMYRAPEILDTYQNYPIGPAQDVWALGCILYYLCYRQHPFEDSAKLRIINAKFTLPDADNTSYAMFHTLIRNTLQPNPYSRPAIGDLCEQVRELADALQVNLEESILPTNNTCEPTNDNEATNNNNMNLFRQSQQQQQQQKMADESEAPASEMFAQLKGQGLSLFKNFKDKSAAVMQNVQLGASFSSYAAGGGQSAAAAAAQSTPRRTPPPVPPPPSSRHYPQQQQQHYGGGGQQRALIPSPQPQFIAQHPQPVRGPPPPSPPHTRHSPQNTASRNLQQQMNQQSFRPPVPPHHHSNHQQQQYYADADEFRGFGRTGLESVGAPPSPPERRDGRPPTPPIDYQRAASSPPPPAEADFLGLGESSGTAAAAATTTKTAGDFWQGESHQNPQNNEFDPFCIFSAAAPTGASESPFEANFGGSSKQQPGSNNNNGGSMDHLFGTQSAGNSASNLRAASDEEDFLLLGDAAATKKKISAASSTAHCEVSDLLGGSATVSKIGVSTMARNVSAPSFNAQRVVNGADAMLGTGATGLEADFLLLSASMTTKTSAAPKPAAKNGAQTSSTTTFDPFGEFLTSSFESANNNISSKTRESTTKSPVTGNTSNNDGGGKPSYSRTHFEDATAHAVPKPPPASAFDDLLSAQGFSASSKLANRTLADLQREENARDMDPIALKIRDWTTGKERNIRALLGSLSEVLWADVECRWVQPSMAELLSYPQIKKNYRKACLVVHPDKQTGTDNEPLAKAIFTELNDAWNTFEASRQI